MSKSMSLSYMTMRIVQLFVIESNSVVSFQIGHGFVVVQFPAATSTVADALVT